MVCAEQRIAGGICTPAATTPTTLGLGGTGHAGSPYAIAGPDLMGSRISSRIWGADRRGNPSTGSTTTETTSPAIVDGPLRRNRAETAGHLNSPRKTR